MFDSLLHDITTELDYKTEQSLLKIEIADFTRNKNINGQQLWNTQIADNKKYYILPTLLSQSCRYMEDHYFIV